jgi:hypothetical protein
MSSSKAKITLKPVPGFCVKTATLQPALYEPLPGDNAKLEPSEVIPAGRKVFVNIAWDANVPPPPEGSEQDIKKAMTGEDTDDGWFVPVVVSHPRQDKDKGMSSPILENDAFIPSLYCLWQAGKPSLVFDCVFNSTVKTRTLIDQDFKIFLIGAE